MSSKKFISSLKDINNIRKVVTTNEWREETLSMLDFVDLSAYLNIPIHILSHVYNNVSKLQKKIIVNDGREVYKSHPILQYIQSHIGGELTNFYNLINTEHLLAYIPGKSYIQSIDSVSGAYSVLISIDIKKYYDSISKDHITNTLQVLCGFNVTTAKMFTHLTTVYKTHPIFKYRSRYLQQGSSTSSVLSNLVGYLFIDNSIFNMIETFKQTAGVDIDYYRYCDNLYLGVRNASEVFNIKMFIEQIQQGLKDVQLIAHKVNVVSRTHPKMAQKILGITINNTMKIGNQVFDFKRKNIMRMLFNTPYSIVKELVAIYNKSSSSTINNNVDADVLGKAYIGLDILNAQINYVKMVNKKQGNELTNIRNIVGHMLNFISKFPNTIIPDYFLKVGEGTFNIVKDRMSSIIMHSSDNEVILRKLYNNMEEFLQDTDANKKLVVHIKKDRSDIIKFVSKLQKMGLYNIVMEKDGTLSILTIIPFYSLLEVETPTKDSVNILEYIKSHVKHNDELLDEDICKFIASSMVNLDVEYGAFILDVDCSDNPDLLEYINNLVRHNMTAEMDIPEGILFNLLGL